MPQPITVAPECAATARPCIRPFWTGDAGVVSADLLQAATSPEVCR